MDVLYAFLIVQVSYLLLSSPIFYFIERLTLANRPKALLMGLLPIILLAILLYFILRGYNEKVLLYCLVLLASAALGFLFWRSKYLIGIKVKGDQVTLTYFVGILNSREIIINDASKLQLKIDNKPGLYSRPATVEFISENETTYEFKVLDKNLLESIESYEASLQLHA